MIQGKTFDLFTYLLAQQNGGGGGSAGGINFKSVTLENDGTYTVIDTKDNTHIITPTTNSDGVITAIVYDDTNINLTYDNEGNLTKIGDSDVDVSLYPDPEPSGNIGYQVTFKAEGSDYYIVSCQQGESITEPPTPTTTDPFIAWEINGEDVIFPYTPSADVEITARVVELPQGYTLLNYLETTGTQYIKTGIKPYDNGGLGISVKNFTPISDTGGQYGAKFFSAADNVATGAHSSGLSISSYTLRLDFNGTNVNFSNAISFNVPFKLECGYSQALQYAYAKKDGVIQAQSSTNNYVAANDEFQILGAFMGSQYPFPCRARFGETIITTSPTIMDSLYGTQKLRHYFPCLDDNQVPCMYDAISNTTFYNSGTGTFLYG